MRLNGVKKKYIVGTILGLILVYFIPSNLSLFFINNTPSMATGIYMLKGKKPQVGDVVLLNLSGQQRDFIVGRKYAGEQDLLIKRVVAMSGDQICFNPGKILINGQQHLVRKTDSKGRTMPQLQLCRKLTAKELFVLGDNEHQSLDSRYLGVLSTKDVVGVVKPFFVQEVEESRAA